MAGLSQLLYSFKEIPEKIYYLNKMSAPMAYALGDIMDITVEDFKEYDENKKISSLLIVNWMPELNSLVQEGKISYDRKDKLNIFALGHCWTEDQTITPEICGLLAQYSYAPWDEHLQVKNAETREMITIPPDERPAEEIAIDILKCYDKEKTNELLRQMLDYYRPQKDYLLIGNRKKYHKRSFFAHESPVKGSKFY